MFPEENMEIKIFGTTNGKIGDTEETVRRFNLKFLKQRRDKNGTETIFEKIIAENIPKTGEKHGHTLRSPNRI